MNIIRKALAFLRGLFVKHPDLPDPPLVGVREPRTRRPGGNAAAVAVLEPDEPESVSAIARGKGSL